MNAPFAPTFKGQPEYFTNCRIGKDREGGTDFNLVTVYPYFQTDRSSIAFFNARYERESDNGSKDKTFKRLAPNGNKAVISKGSTPPYLPFRFDVLEEAAPGSRVLVLEGEKDVLTAISLGFTAIDGKHLKEEHYPILRGHEIVVCGDNDSAGIVKLAKLSSALEQYGKVIRFFPLVLEEGNDFSDLVNLVRSEGYDDDDVRRVINKRIREAELDRREPHEERVSERSSGKDQATGGTPWDKFEPPHSASHQTADHGWIQAADIEPKNVEFLWRDRIVAHRINIVAGMGDVGKDVFCCNIAAIVTTGREWPDDAPKCAPCSVGIISPEDEPEDTIVPRLLAAGADLSRITIWTAKRRPRPDEITGIKLLIVSPLINLMDGQKDMNREQDARDFLELWQGDLKSSGCTVIGTAHLNKRTDSPVVQRILGASGIANYVRSNWTIQRDDEDKTIRLFMRLKANLSPDTTNGLKFSIKHVGPYSQSITCTWLGSTTKTPDQVMASSVGKPSAGRWLVQYLEQNGETIKSKIMAAAAEAGFSESAIQKAKDRDQRIIDYQMGFPGKSYWRLYKEGASDDK